MKRISCLVMAAVVFVCSLTGCREQDTLVSKQGFYFDTVIKISISGKGKKASEKILDQCMALCQKYENIFSRTREDSEVYQINHRSTGSVKVSEDVQRLITAAMEYYKLSDGKFDITVAPLEDLWDFTGENPRVPSPDEIQEALDKVGMSGISLDGDTLTFENDAAMIDLGALAKGYIADRLKEFLGEQGVSKGVINLGGNVLTLGKKSDGSPWKVGIQKPFADRNELLAVVEADGRSVVSSGTYERYFEENNKRYHHVLDPATGYPVENSLTQVTILSDSSLQGDGLSTSCLLLGYEKGRELAESLEGVEAAFVLEDGTIRTTEGMKLIEQ